MHVEYSRLYNFLSSVWLKLSSTYSFYFLLKIFPTLTQRSSVLTLTSFPFRVVFANEPYARMTSRRNILGDSVFDLVKHEGQDTQNQAVSSASSLSSTSSLRLVGPTIVSCANGPFSGAPNGKEEIVSLRCVENEAKMKSDTYSGSSSTASDKTSLRNNRSGLFCRIRVRPVYKFPIKRQKVKDPDKHKVLQYYAVFLDKVELELGSPSVVNVPMQQSSMNPSSSDSTFWKQPKTRCM